MRDSMSDFLAGKHRCNQGFGVVLDVSANGMRIRTPQPPPPNSEVVLRTNVGEDIHEVRAFVRWVSEVESGVHEFGVEILGDGDKLVLALMPFNED